MARRHPRLRALGALFFVAAPLAGLLTAAMLLPWFLGPGLAARSSANLLEPLPSELGEAPVLANSVVRASDGSTITWFYSHNRQPVPSERIAPVMKQALVDIEDSRFYQHNGLDLEGTARALLRNLAAGTVLERGS